MIGNVSVYLAGTGFDKGRTSVAEVASATDSVSLQAKNCASCRKSGRQRVNFDGVVTKMMSEYHNTWELNDFFKEVLDHFKGLPAMEQAQYPENYASDLTAKIKRDFNCLTGHPGAMNAQCYFGNHSMVFLLRLTFSCHVEYDRRCAMRVPIVVRQFTFPVPPAAIFLSGVKNTAHSGYRLLH